MMGAPEPGPARIIQTAGGSHWCEECHADVKAYDDSDTDMYVAKRLTDGICCCCAVVIDNGVDTGKFAL